MRPELIHELIDMRNLRTASEHDAAAALAKKQMVPAGILKVRDKKIAYTHRYRDRWHRPEYDFDELSIAIDSDSYMMRAHRKKVNRTVVAGHDIVGPNKETVKYIKRRIKEFEWATERLWDELVTTVFMDVARYNNCMVHKVRNKDRSSGNPYKRFGQEVQPIAGLFVLPFETLEFRSRSNGSLKKVQQSMPGGETKEYFPRDLIHFYTNRKPGFSVGTPELLPALDDIALLRRIEENVEDLIEANLFPMFHYKVGTDGMPERVSPDGVKETDVVKRTVEYMPAGGVYVSDHRHEITAVGSEGRALRIDFYLNYFKSRALAAIGASAIDMGEGDSANRSTASTLSKGMLMDIEAVGVVVKRFIEFYLFNELLLEGGYDPLDDEQAVHIRFGVVDKEERRADQNQAIQMWHANLRTLDDTMSDLGYAPWEEANMDRTFNKMFAEPIALIGGVSPGSAAGETLAGLSASNITPEAVNKEKAFTEAQAKAAAAKTASSASGTNGSSGSKAASANKAQPANQHGKRASAKTTNDASVRILNNTFVVACDEEVSAASILAWKQLVEKRYNELSDFGVTLESVVYNLSWRLGESNA